MTYFAFTKSLGGPGSYDYHAPMTGQTYTIPDGVTNEILDPAMMLATLTLVMPVNPTDGQTVEVSTTKNLTSLTVSDIATSYYELTINDPSVQGVAFDPSTFGPTGTGYRWRCQLNQYGTLPILVSDAPADLRAAFTVELFFSNQQLHAVNLVLGKIGFLAIGPLKVRFDSDGASFLHYEVILTDNFAVDHTYIFTSNSLFLDMARVTSFVWNGTNLIVYENGVSLGTQTPGITLAAPATGTVYVGWDGILPRNYNFGGGGTSSYIDEYRVWTRAITAVEAANHASVGPWDNTNLQIYVTFNDQTNPARGSPFTSIILNAPITLLAGEGFKYIYRAANTTWYRQA